MRGFTLLEMLVVLVILGMAAALVAPALSRTVERVAEAGAREQVARGIARLPLRVREQGVALRLEPGQPLRIDGQPWPDGWDVIAATPVVVAASGYCAGALWRVRTPGGSATWRSLAPDCRVEDADAR